MGIQLDPREFVKYAWSEEHPAPLASWREALAPLFDIDPESGPFAATLRSYMLGEIFFSVASATGQIFVRDEAALDRGLSDHWLVQMYQAGGFRCVIDGREHSIDVGDVSCLDLSSTFRSKAPAFRCYTLLIPHRLLPLVSPDSPHIRVLPAGLARSRVLERHFATLADLCPISDAFDCDVLGLLTLALLKTALATELHDAYLPSADDSSVFGKVCRFIDAHVTEPELSAERLIAEFGASRATLYRLFHRFGGVASFIRKRRLVYAFRELNTDPSGRERLSSLAHRCGYRNEETFARVFKEKYGVGPAEWRRMSNQSQIKYE